MSVCVREAHAGSITSFCRLSVDGSERTAAQTAGSQEFETERLIQTERENWRTVRQDRGGKSSKQRPRDARCLSFSVFLFLFPRSLVPAVSLRGERPTSSFVHPGMWDILTGWLFIDSTQLRVPPVALPLSLSSVCFYSIISVISQPGLTQEDRVLGNASQRA